jgi:leucyl aminopeptidase (aminopeptidase T)
VPGAAYKAGARFERVLFWDQPVRHCRLRHAPVESLGFVPDWWEALTADCVERRSALGADRLVGRGTQ